MSEKACFNCCLTSYQLHSAHIIINCDSNHVVVCRVNLTVVIYMTFIWMRVKVFGVNLNVADTVELLCCCEVLLLGLVNTCRNVNMGKCHVFALWHLSEPIVTQGNVRLSYCSCTNMSVVLWLNVTSVQVLIYITKEPTSGFLCLASLRRTLRELCLKRTRSRPACNSSLY